MASNDGFGDGRRTMTQAVGILLDEDFRAGARRPPRDYSRGRRSNDDSGLGFKARQPP